MSSHSLSCQLPHRLPGEDCGAKQGRSAVQRGTWEGTRRVAKCSSKKGVRRADRLTPTSAEMKATEELSLEKGKSARGGKKRRLMWGAPGGSTTWGKGPTLPSNRGKEIRRGGDKKRQETPFPSTERS